MRVAFYGIARQVGTSANMAAVAAGLSCYRSEMAKCKIEGAPACRQAEPVTLTDCGGWGRAGIWTDACDLLACNLPFPCRKLEEACCSDFFVRKNVILLIAKYSAEQSGELERLASLCRIERSRICVIPYNPRFIKAYEDRAVAAYLEHCGRACGSYEDSVFWQSVMRAVRAVIYYGNRKGEQKHG